MSDNTTVNPPFVSYPVAPSFNGVNSSIQIPNNASINFNGVITVQAWILPKASDGIRDILAHGYTSNPNSEVYFRVINNHYQFGSWNGADHYVGMAIPEGDLNNWVHLCGVYDGTNWILYRNGSRAAASSNPTGALQVSADWAIGSRGGGTSDHRNFEGLIRNVAIWNTARSAEEVALDMYDTPAENEPGLAAFWPLDAGSGNEAHDYSEHGNNGSMSSVGWFVPEIEIPNTLVCPGEPLNGYVDIGNPSKLNFAGNITIMAWIMPHKTDGIRNIVAHGYTHNPNSEVYFRIINGKYQIGSWNGSDHYTELAIPSEDLMNWTHLAGVYNGTEWILYRNGVKAASSAFGTGALQVNSNWAIGARGDGTSRFLASCVKHVSIWNEPLDVKAINDYVHDGITGSESGLMGYWPLDEGAGPDAFDLSPNPSDGTLQKAGWADMPKVPGWFRATAQGQFQNLNIPVVVSLGRQMWAYAGQYQNTVYASFDGITWETVNPGAPWVGRRSAAGVNFLNQMWLLGGDSTAGDRNDVWSSSDGVTWHNATSGAAWAKRSGLSAVVFQSKIWVFGGGDHSGNIYNDVWNSSDGIHWNQVTPHAQWSPRSDAGAVVYDNKIWIIGGSYAGNSIAEVWSSSDGATWQKHTNPPWPSRFGPAVQTINHKIYVIGGTNTATRGLSDMWASSDGNTWEAVSGENAWAPRQQMGSTVFHNSIFLVGGIVDLYSSSEVWQFNPRIRMT